MAEKTLANLRKVCKDAGIKVKKETMSWGPHVSFIIDGQKISRAGVYNKEYLAKNKAALEALKQIRIDFAGVTHDGDKVYGILIPSQKILSPE